MACEWFIRNKVKKLEITIYLKEHPRFQKCVQQKSFMIMILLRVLTII